MQMFAIVVSFALTVAAIALLVPAVRRMLGVIRSGQADASRGENPSGRAVTMLKETFLHTRMLQWHWVGIMHWFVYAAFLFLSTAVLAAYFQLFKPDFAWPLIGHWYPYEWFSELIGLLSTVGIVYLIVYRQKHHPRSEGRKSRFFGSTFWQAYFVEALALLEGGAILFVRAAEWKLDEEVGRSHYPIASWIGDAFYPVDERSLDNLIYFIAAFKIALAMIWLMVIARNITMGIAWHRFTAWFNIYFKRESDGSTALGAMKPLTSAGKPVTLDDIDDLDEDSVLGVGKAEDFSWKGILDFTTCTECGRCQSQCPAWNTEKPLSPKLLITALRDHTYAKHDGVEGHAERALVGSGTKGESAGGGTDVLDYFYNPADGDFVIDEDVLWSCTSCGACVQQCPVDIEHVDHIMDMRRYQLLVESNFPAELNQLFKGLENKGNPWNMSASARMDWAKGLDFDVPVVGEDLESLESVDWLFWVGCAGAYEDRAKKTTRAVAELLDIAGISFGVLGNGETCTGDPARRAGNEFVFQGLAQQNVETFKEYKVKKVVSTCAHCFNTLKNEYKDFGIELEVVHHTQLLNRLVREGKLTPVKDGAGAAKRSITYHDPCYLGRHNQVYEPPRELLQVLPGAEFVEMERNSEKSFCCGAGGARMWMEENLGERINMNRTREAVGTGADQIAVGCPFCRVMLSDGLTAQQAAGEAREEVEVLDVAQMLLASVKGEQATKAAPGSSPAAAPAGAAAASATDVATKDEPEAGDVTVTEDTVTETADAGPAAKASGGTSLFDTPAPEETTPADKPAEKPTESSGSLFDTPAPEAEPRRRPPPTSVAAVRSSTSVRRSPSLPRRSRRTRPRSPRPRPRRPWRRPPRSRPPISVAAARSSTSPPPSPSPSPSPRPRRRRRWPLSLPATQPPASRRHRRRRPNWGVDRSSTSRPPNPLRRPPPRTSPRPQWTLSLPATQRPVSRDTEPETEPEPEASGTTSTPATDVDLSSVGSLFDIEAPEAPAAPEARTSDEAAAPATESSDVAEEPEPEAQPEPEPEAAAEAAAEPEPEAEPAAAPSAPPSGADLSRAALFADPDGGDEAADDPDTILDSGDAETADEDEPEEEKPADKPAATSDASRHTPRTDVDISGSGSLFDL